MTTTVIKMGVLQRLTMTYITILAFNILSEASQLLSPRAMPAHVLDPRLSSILKANAEISQEPGLREETAIWIDSLRSAPACTQLASSRLVSDCQLLDSPQEFARVHPGQVLEDVESEYALKLAICEYVGAQRTNPTAPPKCHSFLPTREACGSRSWFWNQAETSSDELCYPPTTKADLSRCLLTMQSSAQTWTSYSNARTRSTQICRLSRHHIEMEKAIELHKNLTKVVSDVHGSVRPLESKLQAMGDQLDTYNDNAQQLFDEALQKTEDLTNLFKEAQKQNQETNAGLRNVQSGIVAWQQQSEDFIHSFNAKFNAHFMELLAKNQDAMTSHQEAMITELAASIHKLYQAIHIELAVHLKKQGAEMQEQHEKNMLAIQQQHETAVHSFNILQAGLNSATYTLNGLSDKTGALMTNLDETILKIGTVNDGLHSLNSVAQAAGRFMAGFETLFAYLTIAGLGLGLILFAGCISHVPFIGEAFRKLIMMTLAFLICGLSCYSISQSFAVPFDKSLLQGMLSEVEFSGNSFRWFTFFACAFLLKYFLSVLYKKLFSGRPILPVRYDSSHQVLPQHQQNLSLVQQTKANILSGVGNQTWSKTVLEDPELLERMRSFHRATTVC